MSKSELSSHDSPKTPANPLNKSPTPTPSVPALSLTSLSRSSSLLAAVLSMRSATRSAVLRYCSILCTPSAKRSILGSRDKLSFERCDCNAEGVANVKVKVEEAASCESSVCAGGICNFERISACVGSRSEVSMSAKVDAVASSVFLDRGADSGADFSRTSHAAFSSSSLSYC